jgi:hypothetical protein
MQAGLHTKIRAMLWDIPESRRSEITDKILTDPVHMFQMEEELCIKALNSLNWYELTKLVGKQNLVRLLTDSTIQKIYPPQRRTHYINARRLLLKYCLSIDEGSGVIATLGS